MGALDGHHALVTGAGSGIGAAIARELGLAGAAVSLAGRRIEPLEAVAGKLSTARAFACDVTREEDCRQLALEASNAFGPLDIVIANAGAAESAPFSRLSAEHWQRMINVNLTGAFHTARATIGDVTRAEAGGQHNRRIIFVASTAGLKGYAYVAAYVAAKHGVVGLARALAAELAPSGVTVNAVCPGYTETPLLEGAVSNIAAKTGRGAETARAELARLNPQGRLIAPEDVAATVLWLCLPAARSITGQAISISGGEI